METIAVNFNKAVGKIKPFHGICNAPIVGTNTKLYHFLGDAGIPFSRLHDTGGVLGGGRFVDIENIFRDFDADAADENAYDFAFTDWLLEQITAQGTEIIFRLGATIENDHFLKAYHIFPPKDNMKWAQICEGIIKHYNHGWANGYHYNIRYWEIWNEPDNEPEIKDNPMWKGSKEQYFALYETTANYLKEKFPYIKIGGYASCGFYALTDNYVENAHSSSRTDYFIEFFHEFLQYISAEEHRAPLDFFSWHSYADSASNRQWSAYVREQLNRYGFRETESMLNEWNPGIQRRGTEEDACYISEMMIELHDTPLDVMAYYDGQVHGSYNGLFDPVGLDVFPAYYALHAYNELYRLGTETELTGNTIPMLAASDGTIGKILLANLSDEQVSLRVALPQEWTIGTFRVLEGVRGLTEQTIDEGMVVPAKKIAIIECMKGEEKEE